MKSTPMVSVIMPAYNCEPFISKATESILQQTFTDFELLICDDASTDNTWALLSSYRDSRIRLFQNNRNKGVVYTRNFLLAQAKGKFILIQDADDWSDEKRIEVLLNYFSHNPDTSVCASAHYRVDNRNQVSTVINQKSFHLKMDDCTNLPFMPATLMLRREVYSQLGGYNPFFTGLFGEDWYWIILMVEKFRVYYLDKPLYYHRFNPQSITNTFARKEKLIVSDLIKELIHQHKILGTNWIELNDKEAIKSFASEKFTNNAWLSEKYRIEAAVQRDGKKRWLAFKLIVKALKSNPLAFQNYITLRYVMFK